MAAAEHEHSEHEHKHMGPKGYFGILAILFVLTAITVLTAKESGIPQAWALPVAVAIATIKATLVVLFFMHMIEAEAMNKIVFVVSVVFLLVLVAGSFGDLGTRWKMSLPIPGEHFEPLGPPEYGHGHESTAEGTPGHGGEGTSPATHED